MPTGRRPGPGALVFFERIRKFYTLDVPRHVVQSLGTDLLETVLVLQRLILGCVVAKRLVPDPAEQGVSISPLAVVRRHLA